MRELKRNITRRIGTAVVSLTADGLVVRRFRGRHASEKLIPYAALMDMLGADFANNRNEAFKRPRPKGWQPRGGDAVYIRRQAHSRARGVVVSTIPAVPDPMYSVLMAGGKASIFDINDLRPAPTTVKKSSRQTDLLEVN
jgi:hypothetical protein